MPLNKNNPNYPIVLAHSFQVLACHWRKISVFVVYKGVALLLASATNLKVFITWMSFSPSCQISALKKQRVMLSNDDFTASKTKYFGTHSQVNASCLLSLEPGVEMVSGTQTAVLAKIAEKTWSQAA